MTEGKGPKQEAQTFIKATLDSGTTVFFREYEMADQEQAIIVGGAKAKDGNDAHMAFVMQEELFQSLIVGINGRKLSGVEKETIKKILTPAEYIQAMKAFEGIVPNPTKPKLETVSSFGGK